MTPEKLVEQLRQALSDGLRSVVLYGSAAAGDHVPGKSDYNVLVVAERLGAGELDALSAPVRAWCAAGNPPPRLFTVAELARSADSFPIEWADIRDAHRVLWGADVAAALTVSREHVRLQVERELKSRLMYLRERYLMTAGQPARVAELMRGSVTTFLVLCHATLRLYQEAVPARKLDAARALAAHVRFDAEVFVAAAECEPAAAPALFERYLKTIERIVEAVDR
jgi:predicted nucleotidyltransferase